MDKGLCQCLVMNGRIADTNAEAASIALELDQGVLSARPTIDGAVALADAAINLERTVAEAVQLNRDMADTAAQVSNYSQEGAKVRCRIWF